jgi:hypothetical protein
LEFRPFSDHFIGFDFLAVDKDDLILADFVKGVLSELLAQRNGFDAGTPNSEASLGVIFTFTSDG